jgi:hypothetical protein
VNGFATSGGSFVFMPRGRAHRFWSTGESDSELLAHGLELAIGAANASNNALRLVLELDELCFSLDAHAGVLQCSISKRSCSSWAQMMGVPKRTQACADVAID